MLLLAVTIASLLCCNLLLVIVCIEYWIHIIGCRIGRVAITNSLLVCGLLLIELVFYFVSDCFATTTHIFCRLLDAE
jgi:hypothetical protein